jgi:hypothetical protein
MLKDKKVLVLGLGETGLSALRWLKAQGASLSAADTRETPPGMDALHNEMPEVQVHSGPFSAKLFEKIDLAVISPGVALSEPAIQAAIKNGLSVVGDVELFAQCRPAAAKVHYRFQRQNHGHQFGGPNLPSGRLKNHCCRQYWFAGIGQLGHGHAGCLCLGTVQLSIGNHAQFASGCCDHA